MVMETQEIIAKITKEHIEHALDHIVRYGQSGGKYGITYLYKVATARGIVHKVNGKNEYVAIGDVIRVAALSAMQKLPSESKVSSEVTESVADVARHLGSSRKAFVGRLGFDVKIFEDGPDEDEPDDKDFGSNNVANEAVLLLEQFGQIIFYGPPGTGKTRYAKKLLPRLLGMDNESSRKQGRWNIIQFHPSYNYEDFVRGVRVETDVNDTVNYKTVNKIFANMCELAKKDHHPKNNKYVLIIDEINRADVSAVLGELIYALEPDYRGEQIDTPYAVDGKDFSIVIPKNMYIIGTMNTADRTIGQIDYAVRRRFAFMQCLPDDSVIDDDDAVSVFSRVDKIFDKEKGFVSSDYDRNDVRIGHSYFLADGQGSLARKIVYQVVPILQEYVKDGVLKEEAKDEIIAIKNDFVRDATIIDVLDEELTEESTAGAIAEEASDGPKGRPFYCWEKGDSRVINNVGRTVLSITRDYAKQNPDITIGELQEWFPDSKKHYQDRGIKTAPIDRSRFFTKKDDVLSIGGKSAYVTSQWVENKSQRSGVGSLEEFIEELDRMKSDYLVNPCYVVKINEADGHLSWDACKELGFVSAHSVGKDGRLNTKSFRERIKKGAIVFAFLLPDSEGKKGFIGIGKVSQEAVPINQFKVGETPILDYLFDGQKYRDKYPVSAERANDEAMCDWMIKIDWMKTLSREEAKGETRGGPPTYWWISASNLEIIKEKFGRNE